MCILNSIGQFEVRQTNFQKSQFFSRRLPGPPEFEQPQEGADLQPNAEKKS
jgi:hypothetical protein